MADSFDAVIIGAGHNSLACAAHIAAKGWQVGVFEQAQKAGGAVKTLELTRPGFRHDWAAMNLSLFAGSAFFRTYADQLARHGLEFAPAANCFATAFPDGSWLGVGTDLSKTVAAIEKFSARDAQTWQRLVAEFPGTAEHLFAVLGSSMKMHAMARIVFRMVRRKGLGWSVDTLRFLLSSPRDWLTRIFESNHVRSTLAAWGMHLDFSPDIAGGALFPYLEAMANQSFGMVLGKGGADTMIGALAGMVEEGGGEIHCGRRVERVVWKEGRATGVKLADGTTIAARRAVIANTAPGALIDGLLAGSSGNADYDESMRGFAHAPGTMMIHLALDDLPDWLAGKELRGFAYVHLAPSMDQMARTYTQAKAGLLPDEPVIVVGQPSAIDPGRAPEGKHVLWLQVRMVPAEIRGDAAGVISGKDWADIKEVYAERILDIVERYAPGTRGKIIARQVVSPLDLQADNPNLVGGDQICGSHHLSQHFLFRPARGYASGSTPIKGLYHIGAGTWPGAGMGAGSGFLLGQQLAGA